MHLDIVLSLNSIADVASSTALCTFVYNELENMTDSDYESDPGLEIADMHTASGEIEDMHNDLDTEDISYPLVGAPFGSRNYSRGQQTSRRSCCLYRAQQGPDR